MHWTYLVLGIIFEVVGTTSMKLSQGFTRILPSIGIFVFYGFSFVFVTLSLKKLDVSMVYAIWAGTGTMLITIIGIIYFKEPATMLKAVSIVLIILGVAGLRVSG